MQISITNGTLTQVQETLSPASGYELPATVTVTGATSVYSEGTLILTNPMSTISITASAEEPAVTVPASFADVSLTEEEGYITLTINGVDFNIETEEEPEPVEPFLTFSSPNSFTLGVVDNQKYWDGTLEYSTDKTNWSTWDGTTTLSSASDGTIYVLYVRGTGNTYITGSSASVSTAHWVLTGSYIACSGNIETLLDYQTVALGNHPSMASWCYYNLFRACTSLIFAPELPATTLIERCYAAMFMGCSNLTSAPELPATTLALNCYMDMFANCTSLVTPPALPATTLAEGCYNEMFYNCTKITTAPVLSATRILKNSYFSMFRGCTKLTTAPSLPGTTLAEGSYRMMFYGCTSLTSIPALPTTTLQTYCYNAMFQGCSLIKLSTTQTGTYQTAYRIPTTGTGSTANYALTSMFTSTGGSFKSTPSINTTYYTSNTVIPAGGN